MVSKVGGAVSGGLSGAAAGAPLGPWGAAGGGLLGLISGFMSPGTDDRFRSVLNRQQQGLQNQFINQSGQLQGQIQGMGEPGGSYNLSQEYLQKILSGDPEAFNQFASPYLREFEEQIIPRLSERFAGMGGGLGGGVGSSSGFGQAIGGAGAQLQSNLAGLHANLRQNAAGQAQNQYNNLYGLYNQMAGIGMNPTQMYQPGTAGFGGSALPGIVQAYGQGVGQKGGFDMMQKNWARK